MKQLGSDTFAEIYETQFRRVYNYISYRINNHEDTEDLVSLVFSKVIENYGRFDPQRASIATWIICIARNTITDYYRARQKNSSVDLDSVEPYLSAGDIPDDILIKNERNLVLMKALNSLSARERNVIALKYGAALGNKEVAQVMELSESNVGVILFRSLKKLRAYFEKEESVCRKIAPRSGKRS